MNTLKDMHPEDNIYKVKTFINELQIVQEAYFAKLVKDIKITEEGKDWLFDYIYNCDDKLDDFAHYLLQFNKSYDDFFNKTNVNDILSTDVGEFTPMVTVDPMLHMSSSEPSLATAHSCYNDNEPISFNLPPLQTVTSTDNQEQKL
jgi:hypothetical protein